MYLKIVVSFPFITGISKPRSKNSYLSKETDLNNVIETIRNVHYLEGYNNIITSIYDLTGKQIHHVPRLPSFNNNINLSELPASLYIIEIRGEDKLILRKKLIKTFD